MKVVAERASISKNEKVHIALMDMSKAFDCIDRNQLLEDMHSILENDELFLVKTLLDTELSVRCGNHLSPYFKTDTGAPQGDCLSAVEFMHYLANTLKTQEPKLQQQDTLELDMEYADDMSIVTENYQTIRNAKQDLPEVLGNRGLRMNAAKTVEFTVSRDGSKDWKKCKFLGTLLGTDEDIGRRKGLALDTKEHEQLF